MKIKKNNSCDKPNIFKYGTSELTNDAILAWCLAWGNNKISPLYDLSKDFLELLTGHKFELFNIEIVRQMHHIDLLVFVDDEAVIVIEDKLDTYAREGQLEKYRDIIEKKYGDKKKFYSYVTVGDEANYKGIIDKGYRVVERKDLLLLVNKYKQHSEILEDYALYLLEIEESYCSYLNKQLKDWTFRGWQGFFKEELNKKYIDAGWSYVNNKRDGFQAFYWGFKKYSYKGEIPFEVYLQIEGNNREQSMDKIAFKVNVQDKNYRSTIRNYLYGCINILLEENSLIGKPKVFGSGLTMTYAEIKQFETKNDLYYSIKLAVDTYSKLNEFLLND